MSSLTLFLIGVLFGMLFSAVCLAVGEYLVARTKTLPPEPAERTPEDFEQWVYGLKGGPDYLARKAARDGEA